MMEFDFGGPYCIPNLWMIFFVCDIFLVCVIVLGGKGIIILITRADQALQTPVCFFLSNFFFLKICYAVLTLCRTLIKIWTHKRNPFFIAHRTKACFILMLGHTEFCFLTMTFSDGHVAICDILQCPLVMNHQLCICLMVPGCWMSGVPVKLGQTHHICSLPFCVSNQINHFFCDILPVLKLVHGDTFLQEMLGFTVLALFIMIPFLSILGSYSTIVSTALKSPSATGWAHTFSTCSSHNTLVVLSHCPNIHVPNPKVLPGQTSFSLFPIPLSPWCVIPR